MPITKKNVLMSVGGLFAAIAIVFALYVTAALHWSYSKGERAGFLQKVSDKGWICKTWEGELSLQPLKNSCSPCAMLKSRSRSRPLPVNE
jgi:hypothetical protein